MERDAIVEYHGVGPCRYDRSWYGVDIATSELSRTAVHSRSRMRSTARAVGDLEPPREGIRVGFHVRGGIGDGNVQIGQKGCV